MFIDVDKHPTDINDRPLVDQYVYYLTYYSKIYEKCTVIFQNGSFYEFYSLKDDESLAGQNIRTMEKTLNLNLSQNDKGRLMAGFPIVSKSRNISLLIEKEWMVVQIDQELTKHEKSFNRGVTIIHSIGTYIEDAENCDYKYIVYIFVEAFSDPNFDPISVGISAIDVTTGETIIYEVYNTKDDQNYAFDEITRFLQSHRPKEVLFYSDKTIDGFHNVSKWNKEWCNVKTQAAMLTKIYNSTPQQLCIERFTTATAAFVALLQYCIDHNPELIKNLSPPRIFCNEKYLQLTNNAVSQLDILNNSTIKTANIFNLVNFTKTAMGYRLLKQRLLFPLKDVDEINKRLKWVELFKDWKKYVPTLGKIGDLEKQIRKLDTNPIGMINLVKTILKCGELLDDLPIAPPKLSKLINYLRETIDIKNTRGLFCKGVFSELDSLTDKIEKYNDIFETTQKEWLTFFASREKKHNDKLEMTLDKVGGCSFKLTNTRLKMMSNFAEKIIVLSGNKTYKYCTTEKLQISAQKYFSYEEKWDVLFKNLYKTFIAVFHEKWKSVILSTSQLVAEVDVAVSSAICAEKYNYCKPVIVGKKAFISAQQIRHPIIERISSSIYTPHDITFSREKSGMLLYGFNASGKSSLMKTIGINIILAQAGLYVASKSFEFYPYENILTRIIGSDDLQKGLSSFAVEMSELNGILSRAGKSSLILGDEISHGTESVSGVAIVASAIEELLEKKSHFLFATHLHLLSKMLKDVDKLRIFHLAVERDLKTGHLVYKRDLQEGPGDSLYGIEVARAMRLPDEFITRALKIRKELLCIESKKSRYNSEMFLDKCGVCEEAAEEVHHIRFQSEANDKGFIDHFHKNHLRNLVGLCSKCHKKLHKGQLTIKEWSETSDGFKLIWK